jgi:hypothetical protein
MSFVFQYCIAAYAVGWSYKRERIMMMRREITVKATVYLKGLNYLFASISLRIKDAILMVFPTLSLSRFFLFSFYDLACMNKWMGGNDMMTSLATVVKCFNADANDGRCLSNMMRFVYTTLFYNRFSR